jgi:hypothetical protein
MEIRETQIEDVLVSAPVLAQRVLSFEYEPRLIGHQMVLPSGRLDILYTYKSNFLLVELKAVGFQRKFVKQVLDYKNDLIQFQNDGRLLRGDIQPYLLCPSIKREEKKFGLSEGVTCLDYSPEEILRYFYQNVRPIASFVEIKPIDIGIWNLHLINEFIYQLGQTNSVKELQSMIGGSKKTLYNKIRFANELRLIDWEPNGDSIVLSPLGRRYVKARDESYGEKLSEEQVELLKRHVMQNPYESSVILGIASVVEATFALLKNTYPVPMSQLCEYFTFHSGKFFDWQTAKAKYSATRMYSNYAVDLGLLAKTEQSVYLTPDGFKFTIQMQLHKSLKMMDTLAVN